MLPMKESVLLNCPQVINTDPLNINFDDYDK